MRGVGAAIVVVSTLAACSSGADETTGQETTLEPAPPTVEQFTEASSTVVREIEDGPLVDVCPAVIGVQTAGLPGVAAGPLYRLLGESAAFDDARQSLTGPLVRPDGTVEGVQLELRSGGPAVGFRSPAVLLDADESLLLAQLSTADTALTSESIALTGVTTLTDATHQSLIWDPATYPEVTGFDDLREAAVEIRHVTNSPVIDFLVEAGEIDAEQAVPGFDGEPASFVAADGQIAQLGDLLVDPGLLESLPQWSRPVATLSPRSAGWLSHDDMLVVRSGDVDAQRECLERLVPIIQAAIAAYTLDAAPTNVVMSGARERANPLTRLTPALMDRGVADGLEAGVFGNGSNATVGDFDIESLDGFVETLVAPKGIDPVEIDRIVTNEFIDSTIGL